MHKIIKCKNSGEYINSIYYIINENINTIPVMSNVKGSFNNELNSINYYNVFNNVQDENFLLPLIINDINNIESDTICIALKDDKYKNHAILFAYKMKYNFLIVESIKSFFDENDKYKKIIIFLEPQNIHDNLISDIVNKYSYGISDYHTKQIGIMTARDYDSLDNLIIRHLKKRFSYDNYVFSRFMMNSIHSDQFNISIDTNTSIDNIRNLDKINIFAGDAPGMEDRIRLGPQEFISGWNSNLSNEVFRNKENQYIPYYINHPISEMNVISSNSIKANHIMLSNCGGFSIGGLYNSNYCLPLGFIDGEARSYVASYRVKKRIESEIVMYTILLLNGFSLGETINNINNYLLFSGLEAPCYVLLGDPNDTAVCNIEKMKYKTLAIGKNKITVSNNLGVYEINVDNKQHKNDIKVVLLSSHKEKIYYSLIPHEKKILLFIFTSTQEYMDIEVMVNQLSYIDELHNIVKLKDSLNNLELMNFTSKKISNHINNINSVIRNLTSLLPNQKIYLSSKKKWENNIDNINKSFNFINQELIIHILKYTNTSAPANYYMDNWILQNVENNDEYCNCGVKISKYTVMNPLNSIKRDIAICPCCGIVWDVPHNKKPDVIFSESKIMYNESKEVCLEISAPLLKKHNLVGCSIRYLGYPRDVIDIVEVEKGKSTSKFYFTLPKEKISGVHFIEFIHIVDYEFYYCSKKIDFIYQR